MLGTRLSRIVFCKGVGTVWFKGSVPHQGRIRGGLRGCGFILRGTGGLLLLLAPSLLYALVFMYRPMAGILIAFQEYKPSLGILKVPGHPAMA